jgi:hypothetical protein
MTLLLNHLAKIIVFDIKAFFIARNYAGYFSKARSLNSFTESES